MLIDMLSKSSTLSDADELAQHLRDTPWYIEELYEMVNPLSATTYSDEPTSPGTCGSKPPLSLTVLELIDYEAKWIALLGRSAMTTGALPHRPLDCFYAHGGVPQGLSTRPGSRTKFKELCEHMAVWSSTLYDCEDSDAYRLGMSRTRAITSKLCDSQRDEWLTLREAAALTGRAEGTINQWAKSGALMTVNSDDMMVEGQRSERLFSKRSLELYMKALGFKNRNRKHNGYVSLDDIHA